MDNSIPIGTQVMISKKMKYALKALIYIAEKEGEQVKTKDIAEEAMIPKKFLEQILLELKKGRIINSRQGSSGGYYMLRNPKEISLSEIYRLIDGPIALAPCVSQNFYEPCDDCVNEATCKIRLTLAKVREQTLSVLEQTSIADLSSIEDLASV